MSVKEKLCSPARILTRALGSNSSLIITKKWANSPRLADLKVRCSTAELEAREACLIRILPGQPRHFWVRTNTLLCPERHLSNGSFWPLEAQSNGKQAKDYALSSPRWRSARS